MLVEFFMHIKIVQKRVINIAKALSLTSCGNIVKERREYTKNSLPQFVD